MPKPGVRKAVQRKEKKKKAKKAGWKICKIYEISGEKAEKLNKHCPKCGRGVFMGRHKDRRVCGKCKYVEYTGKQKE